jgi:hypothetical protein
VADTVDHSGRIAYSVGAVRRKLHAHLRTGATLPTNVGYELPRLGGLDGNILDEQPQHALAVLSLRAGSMPETRQVLGESQELFSLFRGDDVSFLLLKFRRLPRMPLESLGRAR